MDFKLCLLAKIELDV